MLQENPKKKDYKTGLGLMQQQVSLMFFLETLILHLIIVYKHDTSCDEILLKSNVQRKRPLFFPSLRKREKESDNIHVRCRPLKMWFDNYLAGDSAIRA